MSNPTDPARRTLLKDLMALPLIPGILACVSTAQAQELPLLSEEDDAAKAVKYVEDAHRAKGAAPGATCASCSIYSGAPNAPQGKCTLFPGKLVKSAGWCTGWSSL